VIAVTIELGPEMAGLLAPLAAAAAAWLGTRSSRTQMKPNGGATIRDAVDRIEEGVAGLYGRVDHIDERVASLEQHGAPLPPPPPAA
jgi:hypothetical protein